MDKVGVAVAALLIAATGSAFGEFRTAPAPARPAVPQNPAPGWPAPSWPNQPGMVPTPQPANNAEEMLLRKQDMIQIRQTRAQILQNAIYCIEAAQVPQQLHACQEQERRQMDSVRNR